MSSKSKQSIAYLGLIMSTLIVGLSFIFVKIGLKYANPMDLLAHRFSAAVLAIVVLWAVGLIKIPRPTLQKAKYLLLLSLFYPLLLFGLQTFGLQYSTASEGGIIFASLPIITLIAAAIFLKEKTTILQKIGILLTIGGVLFIVLKSGNNSGDTGSLKGIVLLLGSVLSMVVYLILGKKIGTRFTPMEITVWMSVLAFIVFNSYAVTGHIANGTLGAFYCPLKTREFIYAMLYLGVLSTMLTAFFTNFALSRIPASQIAVFNNLSPLITILGGVIILGEQLFYFQIIGGLLVMAGVAMTVFLKR